ncbi:MAG TPA: FtsX-like permease family protein [Nitrospira sp.]|nr:FtsX-like permease family protein [Nitrospira sp.]
MVRHPTTASLVLAKTLLRAHAVQQPFRSLLTVTGVALGVVAAVAIAAANLEVIRAFERAVLTVAGPAALEVTVQDLGLDETVLDVIRTRPGVVKASPVIEEAFMLYGGPHGQESVQVYGLDLLAESESLGFRVERESREEALDDLLKRDSVYVGKQLADDWQLRRGNSVEARAGSRLVELRVAGVIEGTDRPGSYWDRVMVMDVAAAQGMFDMIGRLDRIEIVTAPQQAVDGIAADLRAVLPPSAIVQRPAQRTGQVEKMVGAFQLNLAVLSWVGLLIGMFLVYNTMSFAVAQRRREIGIYRALGMTERRVAGLCLLESGVFGFVGGAIGALAGLWLARSLVRLVSRTISDLYVPLTSNATLATLDGQTMTFLVQGILVGVVVSMAGAVGPSLDAGRTITTKALAPGDYERSESLRSLRYASWAFVLLSAAMLCALGPPVRGLPLFGYAATLCLLGAFACLSPVCIAVLRWSIQRRRGTTALSGSLIRMAADHAARHPGRNAVTVSALLVGLAIMIGVVIMVRSFRGTVEVWVDQTVMADLIVAPPAWLHGKQAGQASRALPGSWLAALQAIEGVAAVDTYRDVRVEVQGQTGALVSRDLRLHAERGRYLMVEGDGATVLRRAAETGGVVVSEVLANRLGLHRGERITMTTPAGPLAVPVEGIFYDYATDGGKMVIERALYRRFWDDDRVTVFALYLSPGADQEVVRRRIADALDSPGTAMAPPIVISNGELRREILNIFDRTFVLTYVLEAIAVLVAVLGIVNTLVTAVLERRRELATLQAIGASRTQVERLVQWEAMYLGAIGAGLGTAAGLALAWVLIAVINKQSFGWTIRMTVPIEVLLQACVLAFGAAWIAGYLPARWAARQPIGEGLRQE